MPWNWKKMVGENYLLDFRLDFPMTADIKISESVSLQVRHIIYYDHAPSSMETEYLNTDNSPVYAISNKLHQVTTFQVVYRIY